MAEKQWPMQYFVNIMETGYMDYAHGLRVTKRLAIDFTCGKCKGCHKNIDDRKEILHNDVETATE